MYLLQLQQQHESVRQHNILCGMKSGWKLSRRRVNALTNKRDEDPRNESSTLNLLLVNVIAVGFYIPTFCESNRRRDSSDLAATGVPWHYQCWHSGELHLEHSLGRWDGGGSAGRLPRNSWIVALQTVGWVVFQIRFESDIRTYLHAYISSQRDFSFYFYQKSVYVVCVCMYLMYQRNNVCEKA